MSPGFEAFDETRAMKFDVQLLPRRNLLFILFDLEIAFLFPWAVVLHEIGTFGFLAMVVFLSRSCVVVLCLRVRKKGALEWE